MIMKRCQNISNRYKLKVTRFAAHSMIKKDNQNAMREVEKSYRH